MANTSRTDAVVIIIFAAIGLIIPAVVALRHFTGIDPLALLHITMGRTAVGVVFTLLATAVCVLNFYLGFLVPWQYKRQHGGMEGFACMSGLPVIGGFFILCAGALMPPSKWLGIFLLLLYVIDGNGIPWSLVSVIRNRA